MVLGEHILGKEEGPETRHVPEIFKAHSGHDEATYKDDIAIIRINPCATVSIIYNTINTHYFLSRNY